MNPQSLQGDAAFSTFLAMCSWKATRFGALFPRRREVGRPDASLLSVFLEKGVVPRSKGDGNNNRPGDDLSKYLVVHHDDLVFNKLRTWQGGFGVSRFDGIVSPAYFVCRPNDNMVPRFVDYLLRSHIYLAELTRISKWMPPSQFDIAWEDLRTLPIVTPDISTQKRITDFLDRETVEADSLVARYETFIELLLEKRVAIVARNVTRGLRQDVAMKDSGVGAIGDIPSNWSVVPAKRLLAFVTSGSRGWADYYSDMGDLFLRIGNLSRTGIDLDLSEPRYVQPPNGAEGQRTKARSGDLLISITADLGSVAIVPDLTGPAYVSQHVALCRPREGILSRWLAYAFFSRTSKVQLLEAGYGGTKIQLSLPDVKNVLLPLPSYQEQEAISRQIDIELAESDHLLSLARESITLVKERRAGLITAAVTGKIDVSKYKPSHKMEAIS